MIHILLKPKMGSKSSLLSTLGFSFMFMIIVFFMVGFVRSDVAKDREECTNQLITLATCLPYVGGTSKAPTPDCCKDLKQVLAQSKKCLCILVRDRNDPALGLKINATLALSLPTTCKAQADIKKCPSLLHLAPNSPQARVFEEFEGPLSGNATTPTTTSNNGNSASPLNGGKSSGTPSDGHTHSHKKGEIINGVFFFSIWSLTLIFIMGV